MISNFRSIFCLSLTASIAFAIPAYAQQAEPQAAAAVDQEAALIAILQSDAPKGDKAVACKKLTVHGSSKAVPELAKLLTDEQLASWARIPLEAIPGKEADEALRTAANSVKGRLLIGMINSIGVRRDAAAVEDLTKRLTDEDADVASAAGISLGKIGGDASAKALQDALAKSSEKVRSAVAEGCVLCAERFHQEGKSDASVALYDVVRKADVPKQRIREATRGAILARKEQGIPLLIEQFKSFDNGLFQIGLSTAREFPGSEVDKALAAEMANANPNNAALIIGAMADRPETVVLPAILKAAGPGSKTVRLAAITALGKVGNTSCLPSLLEYGVESDTEIAQTSKKSLSEVPGDNVDKYIVTRLEKAEGKVYPLLLELVGNRRIQALPLLMKAIDNSDAVVRSAALTALGATVPPEQLSVLIKQAVSPKRTEDTQVALAALKTASVRMPDREATADELTTALDKSSVPTKIAILKILGDVAGTKALQTIGVAARNSDPQIQDAASELLGNWLTIDAAPVLLDLVKTAPQEKFQIRAMRGYIKIARQFAMPEPERIEMCHKATAACTRTPERKLVIEVLRRYPSLETLKMAIKTLQDPELKDDGNAAILIIAPKLTDNLSEAKDLLAKLDLPKSKVEVIKAEYGEGANQKDVTEVLAKSAKGSALILLPSVSYNESFGGDPAPGGKKQLKIQYKLNDIPGDVALNENAFVVLPVPKEKK